MQSSLFSMSKRLLDQVLLNPNMFSPLHLAHAHAHTHLRKMQNHSMECDDILSNQLVHWLPNNIEQLYALRTMHN
jgi:hypothetical protein